MKEILIYNGKIADLVFGSSLNPADYPDAGDELLVVNLEETKTYAISNRTRAVMELNDDFPYTVYGLYHYPEGMQVKCLENEVRIMCPRDTKWEKREVGAGGDQDTYYMMLKIYAPNKNIKSFKEGTNGAVDETMLYFENNPFAAICDDGRKYSILWLGLAHYDETTDSWVYYGNGSTEGQYVGWNYMIEWYDENENLVSTESLTLHLSNEDCH